MPSYLHYITVAPHCFIYKLLCPYWVKINNCFLLSYIVGPKGLFSPILCPIRKKYSCSSYYLPVLSLQAQKSMCAWRQMSLFLAFYLFLFCFNRILTAQLCNETHICVLNTDALTIELIFHVICFVIICKYLLQHLIYNLTFLKILLIS